MGSVAYRKTNADRNITSRDGVTTSQRRGVITSQRPNRVMSDGQNRVTTSQKHLWPDHGLISAAGTSRSSLHQIRPLRRGTTARRFTQFRTDSVSHTEDVRTVRQIAPNAVQVNKSKSTWPWWLSAAKRERLAGAKGKTTPRLRFHKEGSIGSDRCAARARAVGAHAGRRYRALALAIRPAGCRALATRRRQTTSLAV
jgi:hypothetical protein